MGYHDTAQICLNGHVINSQFKSFPEDNKKFCDKCGAKTITSCTKCNFNIQGNHFSGGFIRIEELNTPSFCINCGSPYPWTESKLQAAKELAEELELTSEEKEILLNSIMDIVKETPKTEVAITRFKKIMLKMGKETSDIFRNLLIDIVSETVKKMLWSDNK